MPSSETRSRASRRRTASGSAPATVSRSPVRERISGQARSSTCRPFRGSCLPAKTTRCSRPPAGAAGGTRTPFGMTSYSPGSQRFWDSFARSETAIRWSIRSIEEAPQRRGPPHPAEIARRVERRDERAACADEGGQADRRRHRLVQMEHVEALALERAHGPEERARREHDVRERAVRGHDHRAPHRDDVVRRLAVAPDARVQDPGELARRVVAHHQAHVVAELLERRCLQLRVLDDRTPERPRERDDDPDLHEREPNDGRLRWARCVSTASTT